MAAEPRRNHSDHELPRKVGGYDAFLQIGAGGMARVYLAAQRTPAGQHQVVVVKVLRREAIEDEHVLALFMDEARIAMRLSHPNVIRTRDVVADPPDYLLAMEFQNGQSLLHVLRRLGRQAVPLDEHVYVLGKVLAGLGYAHELKDDAGRPFGIVHRDVSPSNVLVCYTGEVKLLDFGIAKATGALAATQDGVVKGKLGYAAPEQCLGKPADPRSDIYAVGVMLWEAIAGRRRASGETWHSVLQARLDDSEPELETVRPDAPPALLRAARRALAHDPEQRYQTAKEFQRDLEEYLASQKARVGPARIAAMLKPHFDQERAEQHRAIEAYLTSLRSNASGQRRRVPLPASLAPAQSAPVEEEDTSKIPVDDALLMKSRRGSMMPPADSAPSNPSVAPAPSNPTPPSQTSHAPPSSPSATEAAGPPTSRSVAPSLPYVPPPPGAMRRSLSPPPSSVGPPSSGRATGSGVQYVEAAAEAPRPSVSGTYPLVGEPIVVARQSFAPLEPKKSGGRSVIFAAVGLVALAAAGALVLRREPAESKASTSVAGTAVAPQATLTGGAPAPAADANEVKVRIAVDPSNAELRLDGRLLNGNPFVSVVPREATLHELAASADGYREEKQVVQFMRDVDLSIALHRAKPGMHVAPARAPIPPAAAAAAMKPQVEARPSVVEPGMDLQTRPDNRGKHNIDEKDPYSQ
ncbi:MAG TPA: protein kinase [Polyangiaceae bacterium]|nr:protein kinase [Polyangiaceae bacterium]